MKPLPLRASVIWLARTMLLMLLALFALQLEAQEPVDPVELDIPAVEETPTSVIQRPRWELGLGGGYFSSFDYPASKEASNRGIVLPFFVYRSPVFRTGSGGIRAVAIERPRLTLDLSVGGSLNANSVGNTAREGMPDLDFLFEVGPQLKLQLLDKVLPTGERLLGRFTADVRAVFATDFRGVDSLGAVADIGLGLTMSNVRGTGISVLTGLELTYATEPLQDYFYQVEPEFVTPERAFFDAKAGYLESTLFAGFAVTPLPNVRLFTGFIKGFFQGAENADSPLFEVNEQTRFAVAFVWTIAKSKKMIDVVDLGSNN